MQIRSFTVLCLAGILGVVLVGSLILTSTSVGQGGGVTLNKNTPKPASTPRRPSKPTPKRPPKGVPLTVQYRMMKAEANNAPSEVNVSSIFNKGDRLKFGFKANQDGFLFIIKQTGENEPGRIFFPDSNINSGQNHLDKNTELILPPACPGGVPAAFCWYPIDDSGTDEFFTVVFSKSSILMLGDKMANLSADIPVEDLKRMLETYSKQLSKPERGDSVYAIRISNTDRRASDQLVVRYSLNKKK